jgi:hypothetical protein
MKKITTPVLILSIVGIIIFTLIYKFNINSQSIEEKIVATIHKSSTCGCCGVYATYMKREGYEVVINDTEDLEQIKKTLVVPQELESCHTTEVAGYVVEGHIPNEVIKKLLNEKPDIKGIGMAGMPTGSPGMPGAKTEEFKIYEINNDGSVGNIFVTI